MISKFIRGWRWMQEASQMRDIIEHLVHYEGDSVTILCADPEADHVDQQVAIDCGGAWTSWVDQRFYGRTYLDCLQRADYCYRNWLKEQGLDTPAHMALRQRTRDAH